MPLDAASDRVENAKDPLAPDTATGCIVCAGTVTVAVTVDPLVPNDTLLELLNTYWVCAGKLALAVSILVLTPDPNPKLTLLELDSVMVPVVAVWVPATAACNPG
jgi:hypothetical protein